MSNVKAAMGTHLQSYNGSAFVSIAELTTISGPTHKLDMIEVSNMDSVNSFKEFIAGLVDAGEVSFSGNWLPADTAQQLQLITDIQAGNLTNYKITFPAAVTTKAWAFSGYVVDHSPTYDYTKEHSFSAKIKITGKPTLS